MKVFTKKDETLPENWEQEPNYIWIGGGSGELKASPLDNDFIGKKTHRRNKKNRELQGSIRHKQLK